MNPDSPQRQNGSPSDSSPLDPEDIAALLDGRLSPARRAELLQVIASDPAHVELYADIVGVMHSLEQPAEGDNTISTSSGPVADTIPLAPLAPATTSNRRWQQLIPWSIAAILVISVLWQFNARDSNAIALGRPAETVALLSPITNDFTLPPHAFAVRRGDAAGSGTRGLGIRVGADIAEATILAGAGNGRLMPQFSEAMNRVADNLSGDPAGAVAGSLFRDLAATPDRDSLAPRLQRASDAAEQFVDVQQLRVGAWLATLRIAATHHDTKFFERHAANAGMQSTRQLAPQDTVVLNAVTTLERLVAANERNWTLIDSTAAFLLRQLAR